jgi:hypothetical protein
MQNTHVDKQELSPARTDVTNSTAVKLPANAKDLSGLY